MGEVGVEEGVSKAILREAPVSIRNIIVNVFEVIEVAK